MSISVGIDIGASAVKVAVIRTAYRKTTLEALGSADVAASGGVAEAIRAATASVLTTGKPPDAVAAALDGVRIAVHRLSLPASAIKQIAEVLPFELEAALPVDMAESVFDYRILPSPRQPEPGPPQMDVLAVVARTEDVRARIDLVKDAAGVEPERIGAGALPLANLASVIPALSEPGPIVLMDLGTRTSEVLVLVDGEPTFARTASFGTQGLPGSAPKLARELRVTIAAYRAAGGEPPARVFLCGGGSFVSGAQAFLAAELDIAIELLPPPALDLAAIPPERVAEMACFSKALGLALGLAGRLPVFDLRRGPLTYERGFAWVRDKVPVLAGLGAVIVVSFLFSAWAQLYAANKDRASYEAALATVTREVLGEETTSAARAQELLSQQSGSEGDDPMPHVDAFDVMVKLSEDIPQSTTHDVEELDIQKQHATLHGIVGTVTEAQSIKTSLETEKCFSDVKISRFNQVVGGERQKYVLDLDLKCPEDTKKKKPAAAAPASSGGE